MMVAMMLVTVFGLAASLATVSSTTIVSAATDKWSRMDLPTTLNYQMLPDSDIWDLTAADDGTLFAVVEDTTGDKDIVDKGAMDWDGLRWAVYPAYSDVAIFKSTDGGYEWTLMWHMPSSETGAPITVVPQPGYVDSDSANDNIFFATGSRYISGDSDAIGSYAGGLSQGNIYRSLDAGKTFTRVTPRCPAVTLAPHGPNTGGTITSLDVAMCPLCASGGCQNPYMAIVGVSSINTSEGNGSASCGEGVWTWNQNNTNMWQDLQISNTVVSMDNPPMPGTMPAGNGLDVIQVYASRNFATDGCIVAVANDIISGDPADEDPGIYVCFYDANDGTWGGDIDSPTTATKASWEDFNNVAALAQCDYAGAASMDTGTDFSNVVSCYVFVSLDGTRGDPSIAFPGQAVNDDLYRVRGLATVTGPSVVTSCNVEPLLITGTDSCTPGDLNDDPQLGEVCVPGDANAMVYVGCEFPDSQAQVLAVSNAVVWPSVLPSMKPPSGEMPVLVTNKAGTIMAAGGSDDNSYTSSGVSKMVAISDGTAFNGVGLLDDIAVSEDIPGASYTYGPTTSDWVLAEAVNEEVSPTYDTDGLIYVTTWSDWWEALSMWRLTDGNWERVMVEELALPNGYQFDQKDIMTNIDDYTFYNEECWNVKTVPQFSTDPSMFALGGRDNWKCGLPHGDDIEIIWFSPDKGNYWKALPQMPIGAYGWGAGNYLCETGWCVVDSNTLFVGDDEGWIYKTTNRGASWTDGALTGRGLEIDSIVVSPIYSESGASGTDKVVLVGTYDADATHECEVWISQDGCIKDLENIGDEIYVSPSWAEIADDDLGGTVVNFDKNWATNKIIYAASAGWLDQWWLASLGQGNQHRVNYTDVSVVRTTVDLNDPSASTWQTLWSANDYNAAAPLPQPIPVVVSSSVMVFRVAAPTALQIGPDGTIYVAFALGDSSYNHDWITGFGDVPTPNDPHYGRFTLGGMLRCLDGTIKTPEFEIMHDGLGPWDGLYWGRVVAGNNHCISLTFDWKEWRFKLAFWEDTLSGAGPAAVSPVTGAQGVGALVADTSVNVPLSWQAKGGASQYEWQVSEDSAFSASNTKSGTTSDLTVTVLDLKPATTYFWRTRALEPMLGKWSTAQTFTTVIGGETGAPSLITPEIGATIADETPLFTWSGVASASNYQIQVATSPTFGSADIVIDEELGNVQAYEADKELVNGTYYWQVKGTNATTDTETPWSQLGSFTLDTEAGGAGTPVWVWVLIVLGVLLGIVVLVLILRTRRPV